MKRKFRERLRKNEYKKKEIDSIRINHLFRSRILELHVFKSFLRRPEDRYDYQENDRRLSNDPEPLYEELKKVYDWPEGELKSGPRLRGDQRLRYESDDKLDTKPSQLRPLDDRLFGSNQNGDAQRRLHSADASRTSKCWMHNHPRSATCVRFNRIHPCDLGILCVNHYFNRGLASP